MADGVFSLKNIFTTAALALAVDLLFVFPVSHFSSWGQHIANSMAQMYGFLASPAQYAAASTAAITPVMSPTGTLM